MRNSSSGAISGAGPSAAGVNVGRGFASVVDGEDDAVTGAVVGGRSVGLPVGLPVGRLIGGATIPVVGG